VHFRSSLAAAGPSVVSAVPSGGYARKEREHKGIGSTAGPARQ
jgi:hypothetical protein